MFAMERVARNFVWSSFWGVRLQYLLVLAGSMSFACSSPSNKEELSTKLDVLTELKVEERPMHPRGLWCCTADAQEPSFDDADYCPVPLLRLLASPFDYRGCRVWIHGYVNADWEGASVYLAPPETEVWTNYAHIVMQIADGSGLPAGTKELVGEHMEIKGYFDFRMEKSCRNPECANGVIRAHRLSKVDTAEWVNENAIPIPSTTTPTKSKVTKNKKKSSKDSTD